MRSLGLHKLPTLSRTNKWMAAIPCPDTEMNKRTRLMQYEYDIHVNILYTGYLVRNSVTIISAFKMLIYPFRSANLRFQNGSLYVLIEAVRRIVLISFSQ